MRTCSVLFFLFLALKLQGITELNDSIVSIESSTDSFEVIDSIGITDSVIVEDILPQKIQNVFGFVPSNATTINGWAKGWMVADDYQSGVEHINGLYTNVVSLGAFLGVMALPYVTIGIFSKEFDFGEFAKDTIYQIDKSYKRLNGLSLSIADVMSSYAVNGVIISGVMNEARNVNGLAINGLSFKSERLNGIAINGFSFKSVEVNGLLISGIYNEINRMRGLQIGGFNNNNQTVGVQIGLFNKTNKLKGVQLGLWNKNGKLGLPFLNIGW